MAERPISRRQISDGPLQTAVDEVRQLANDSDRTINRMVLPQMIGPYWYVGLDASISAEDFELGGKWDGMVAGGGDDLWIAHFYAIRDGKILGVSLNMSHVHTADTLRFQICKTVPHDGVVVIIDHKMTAGAITWIEEFKNPEFKYNRGDRLHVRVVTDASYEPAPEDDLINVLCWLEIGFEPSNAIGALGNEGGGPGGGGGGYWFPPDV